MKKNLVPQLLTYFTSHRCAAEDTQNLFLGTREMKPLLSVVNKIQILMEKQFKEKDAFIWNAYQDKIDDLMIDIETALREDVENYMKGRK